MGISTRCLEVEVLARQPLMTWGFAACYVVIGVLTWMYFFVAPGMFATAVALCLVVAALQARRSTPALDVVKRYFDGLARGSGWQDFFDESVAFTSYTSPVKRVNGREPFLTATRRFYGSIGSVEVRDLAPSDDKVYALTRYGIRAPNGAHAFDSDVAEVFRVRDGRIVALDIYFDTAPFPK